MFDSEIDLGRKTDRESAIVAALRRIIRAVDLHSRRLLDEHGLTGPQLVTLRAIAEESPLSPAMIAERVHLSRGTVTGILSRLESHGLVARTPSAADRRSVEIALSDLGRSVLARTPSLLQERFRSELRKLAEWEQLLLLSTLQRIASMMDAEDLDASPHLVVGTDELSAGTGTGTERAPASGSSTSPGSDAAPGPRPRPPGTGPRP